MKVFASFITTLLYTALMVGVFFAVQGIGYLLKSVGMEHFVVGLIIVGYFLYIWRDAYKKMTKGVV